MHVDGNTITSYPHDSTIIIGKEGVLVDTGAIRGLTGGAFLKRMQKHLDPLGLKIEFERLEHPQSVGGAGGAVVGNYRG